MNKKLKVTRERRFSAHHILIGAARASLQDAEAKRPGWFYSELTTITMSALGLEAICNAFCERIRPDWKEFESLNPIAKLIMISERLNINIDFNVEPWSTAKWLYKIRNKIAHAKPEIVKESYEWTREEYEIKEKEWPKSKLEGNITIANARRALKGIEDIKNLLFKKLNIDDKEGLYSDSWSGMARLISDDG